MILDLPAGVVSIEVLRENRRIRQLQGHCPHVNMAIHALDGLYCRDCNRQIEPIGWIMERMEDFNLIIRRERAAAEESKRLQERMRTKCQHCQKMTIISR